MRIRVFIFFLLQFISFSVFSQSKQSPRLVLPIGHTDVITSAKFSPEGKKALTMSNDKTAKLYEVASGKEIYSFEGHSKPLTSSSFSPDGSYVLTSSLDGTAIIYSLANGEKKHILSGHTDRINSAVFSPDGKFVLTSSSDKTVRIFDAASGTQKVIFSNHNAPINSAVFSMNGLFVLTASSDGTARLFQVENGKEISVFHDNSGELGYAAFSPDQRKALTWGTDSILKIFDLSSGEELVRLIGHSGRILSASFSPDGTMVATSSVDSSIKLFNSEDGREIRTLFPFRHGYINSIEFSPDSKFVVTAGGFEDFCVRLFDVESGNELRTWSHERGQITSAEFSFNGKMIISSGEDGKAQIYNISSDEVFHVLDGNTVSNSNIAISPDGSYCISAIERHSIRMFQINNGEEIDLNINNYDSNDLVFSRDGKKIFLLEDDVINVFDFANREKIQTIYASNGINLKVNYFDTLGNIVVPLYGFKSAHIFNIQTGEEVGYVGGGDYGAWMNSSAISLDGKRIITTSKFDSLPEVFDAKTGEVIFEIQGHAETVNYACYSPNGKLILTCSDDGYVRLFDAEKGTEIKAFVERNTKVLEGSFNSDGNIVLTRSRNNVKLWDVSSGEVLQSLSGHSGYIYDAFFIPKSKYVITTGDDHKTILWDVETGKILYTRLQLENNDWLVYDEDYRFDGSPGAIEKLYFTCGLEIIELGQMKDALYVPGLAEKIINGDDINYTKLSDLDICGALPLIEKTEENESGWKFIVEQRRWPIVRVDVKVDGKIVKSIPSNQLKFEAGIAKISLSLYEMQHFFVGGKENVISISAVTSQNGSEIKSRGIDVLYLAEESKDPPRMFLLMIGVNDYKDDALDLVFPAHDARALGNALELSAKKLLGEVNVEIYHVQSKTKDNKVYTTPEREGVMKALADIGSKAKANDVLFIFFAGHGVMHGQSDKSFTFLTADASQMNQIGISTTDLISWLSPEGPFKMLPNKTILVYDACNSGQAAKELMAAMVRSDDDTERLRQIEELGDKSGLFILSASAPNKPAYELPQLGQGLLTYSLLCTLKNNPNIIDQGQDGNGYLNLQKWFLESEREQNQRVLSLGLKQEAQPYGTGNIKLGVVDDDVRNAIQLIDEKPLVFCGNARDENDEDPLELKSSINDYFENAAARGLSAPLAFVSAETPNANVVKLIYSIDSNQVKCRVLFFKNKVKTNEVIIDSSKDEIVPKIVETITSTIKI